MPYRTLPAAALVAGPSVAWTATAVLALDEGRSMPLIGIALALSSTISLTALCMWGIRAIREHVSTELSIHDQHVASAYSTLARQMRALDAADTEPLPAVRGAAVVAQTVDDMPGYAMGYADGLARKPMIDGKVVPLNGKR